MLKDSNPLKACYQLGVVSKAEKGEDGVVRRIFVKYKNIDADTDLKKVKFHETERSVQNVSVLVPVDWSQEDIEVEVMKGLRK